jgi:hypothetical protein
MREVELLKESEHQNILESDGEISTSTNFFDTFAKDKNKYFTAAKTLIANEIGKLNDASVSTDGLVRIIQNKEKFFEADEEVSLDDKSTIIKLAANITGLRLLNSILSTIMDNTKDGNINKSFAKFFAELDAQSKTGATKLPILKVYGGDHDAEIITKAGIVRKTTKDITKAITANTKDNKISPIVIRLNQVNDKDYLSVNLFYIINFENNEFIYMNMMLRSNTSGTFTFAAENSKTVTLKSIIK